MKSRHEFERCCCGDCSKQEDSRMTHSRDYGMEGNRPQIRSHEELDAGERNSNEKITQTGLVHRQPL